MGRTRTNLRQATLREFGFPARTGTSTASSATTLTAAAELGRFVDDELIGHYLYLNDATVKDRRITDSTQAGVATFIPSSSAGMDGTDAFELLPLPSDAIHEAIQNALLHLYDLGILVRPFWLKGVTGSPIYNSDFSYWTSATGLHGWDTGGTPTRSQAAADKWINENTVSLAANGSCSLTTPWTRFLADGMGDTVKLRAWVKTSTASNTRIGITEYSSSGSATTTYSSYAAGSGIYELLTLERALPEAGHLWLPLLARASAAMYVNDIWVEGLGVPAMHPIPLTLAPSGPSEILLSGLATDETNLAAQVNPLFGHAAPAWTWETFHDEAADVAVGAIVWRQRPPAGLRMWMKCEGPLTLPTADADVVEIDQIEELLVAKMAALKLLENDIHTVYGDIAERRAQRVARLQRDIDRLAGGHGDSNHYAVLGPQW